MALHLVPRSLQYVEQVAHLGSIQAASRETGISASAIHRQIKAIEDDLGELIFDRDAKGMILTPAGRLILDLARNWRFDSAKLWSLMQATRGVEYDHVRIAAMDGMVNGLVLELASEISHRFPRVQAEFVITSPDSAVKGLLNGDFDIAFVANPQPNDNLVYHWTREFPLGCIAAPQHPVAAKVCISLEEFVTFPVAFQATSLPIRKFLEAQHGWIFERVVSSVVVSSVQLMKLLAVSGKYIALTSEVDAGPEISAGLLKFIPISNKNIFQQSTAIISNAQMPLSNVGTKIISIATQILDRQNDLASDRFPL